MKNIQKIWWKFDEFSSFQHDQHVVTKKCNIENVACVCLDEKVFLTVETTIFENFGDRPWIFKNANPFASDSTTDSSVLGFDVLITMTTICSTRVMSQDGFDALLKLFPAVPLRACFRSGLSHQIYHSQPAVSKALVDPDVSCPKIQVNVARNPWAETQW